MGIGTCMDKVNLIFCDASGSSRISLFKIKDARISNQCCSIRVRQKFADLLQRPTQDVLHFVQILCFDNKKSLILVSKGNK